MENVKGVVDVVFLMDATESMQKCIDKLKENLMMFIEVMTDGQEGSLPPVKDWRAKIVGFRDYDADGVEWLEDNLFTNDVKTLYCQLDKLRAHGGGDEPESLLDALYKVGMMEESEAMDSPASDKWRHRSRAVRIVVVFTDAPFHEPMTIPEAVGGMVDDVINLIHAKRLILSVYAPRYDSKSNQIQDAYCRLACADRAEYIPLLDDDGNDVSLDKFTGDTENFQKTLQQLAKTLTRTAAVEEL